MYIDDEIAYSQYKDYLNRNPEDIKVQGNVIVTKDYEVTVEEPYQDLLELARSFNEDSHVNIIENSGYKFKTY